MKQILTQKDKCSAYERTQKLLKIDKKYFILEQKKININC